MKKRILWISLLAVLLIGAPCSSVLAAGPGNQNSTEFSVAVIGENVEMEIKAPLEVEVEWTTITIDLQYNEANAIYPGQTIVEGELTITNVSPITQAAYLTANPISVGSDGYPCLEVIATGAGATFLPWQQIVIAPGTTIALQVEIRVAYGSDIITFHGLNLRVIPVKPTVSESG